jgi:hypothetical protein
LENTLAQLRSFADANLYTESRRKAFHFEREFRRSIHQLLRGHFVSGSHGDTDAAYLGLEPHKPFEVRSARIAYRTRPDSGLVPQFVVTLLQRSEVPMDPNDPNGQKMLFDGGCTLVADLRDSRIQYCIRKNTSSDARLLRQQGFAAQLAATSSSYFGTLREGVVEPFAAIHRGM